MTFPRLVHDPALRARFPTLQVATLMASGLDGADLATLDPTPHLAVARERLQGTTEGELPSIKAWRAAYSAMGLKPTQYRSAPEALLRRLRIDGALPRLDPLVDFANAVSAAAAIPLAVFDLDAVVGALHVTFATGDERYLTFSGEIDQPEAGEVIFRDEDGWAHARRWVHRQSARSAVTASTRRALFVAEAMRADDRFALEEMIASLRDAIVACGAVVEPDER